ncbi:MAG TPA: RluA family pseudouridine synthase [Gaiellales bacterium]|nr:RluA family pseudouridine synthase [Gaiellales bacterium]
MTRLRLEVDAASAGSRLDRFLAGVETAGTRGRVERLIAAGRVTVDGVDARKALRLRAGQVVELEDEPPQAPPPVHTEIAIAYQDDRMIVVDKPAGLVVHAAPGHRGSTLVDALGGRAGGGPPARTGIVHRLDRDTSGLLIVARDERTLATLQLALRRRMIERTYLTLVRGRPPSRRGTIEAPIGRDRGDPTRISIDSDRPRAAITHFSLEQPLEGRSLLRVQLDTGRTHQIRVHLQAIGHPVVGDPTYGHGPELGLTRQFLHAAELRLPHPDGGELHLRSPLPADLVAALELARAGA